MRLMQGLNLGQVVGARSRSVAGQAAYTTVKPPVGARLDTSHSLNVGRVVSLLCNEGNGATVTDTGRSATPTSGTISGPTWATDANTNRPYLTFNTDSDYIQFDDTNMPDGTQDRTLHIRLRLTGSGEWVMNYGAIGSNGNALVLHGVTSVGASDWGQSTPLTPNLSGGTAWHTVTATVHDLQTWDIYADGVLIGGGPQTTNTIKRGTVRIGHSESDHRGYVGALDSFSTWNRVLTPTEIADIAANPYRGYVS